MLFFLFLTITSQCTSYDINLKPDEILQSDEPNNNQSEKCACYNITGETVTKKLISLSTGNSVVERLVVYFYREMPANKMYIYIPKEAKQYSLPEFSFDVGDDLRPAGSETMTHIVNDEVTESIVTSDKPYTDYHSDEDEKYYDEINEDQQETEQNYHTNSSTDKSDYLPVSIDVHDENDSTDFDSQNLPETIYTPANEDINIEIQNYETNHNIPDKIDNDENNAPVPHNKEEQQVNFSDSDLKPAKVTVAEVDGGIYDNSEFGQYTLPYEAIADDNDSKDQMGASAHVISSPFGKYISFDTWFDQQMYRINKTRNGPNKNIDFPSLKLLIEKALYDNHMYITKDGVLIDTYGNALNAANLKLWPILVGNAVPYNILLNVKDNKVELPTDVPYLEAVLVTLMYPPKVLGVIPLGKTYISPISYRRAFNFWAPQRLSACTAGKCSSIDSPFNARTGKSHRHRKGYHSYLNIHKVLGTHTKYPTSNKQKVVINLDPSKYEGAQKLDILRAIKSLFKFNKLPIPSKDKNSIVTLLSDEDALDEYLYRVVGDYEIPGFRIIGGSAATGSGTPLSSRGRSGVLLDE